MNAATLLAAAVLAVILYFAIRYIYKEKKKGNACIGCPYSASCPKHNQGGNTQCGSIDQQRKDHE